MSLLDVLGGLATATGMGLQGYAQDQKDNLTREVQAAQLARQAQNDAVENALKRSQTNEADVRSRVLGAPPAKPKRSLATFSVNGQPTLGSIDEDGNFFDAAGNHVSNAAPYNKPPDSTKAPSEIPGTPEWKEAKIAEARIAAQYAYHPPVEPTIIQGTNPDGTPAVFRVPKQGGPAEPVEGITPKVGGVGGAGATSGNTLLAQGRIGLSYNDLAQAVKQMEDYENSPANLQAFTPEKRTLGVLAQSQPNGDAHGLTGMLGNILTSEASGHAQKTLAKNDQAYQNYVNNAQRVGAALTELLPRPNQQMLGIEKGLSAIDVGANPGNIANVQTRRRGALQMLQGIMQHGGVPGTGTPTGSSASPSKPASDDPEFEALLNKYRRP